MIKLAFIFGIPFLITFLVGCLMGWVMRSGGRVYGENFKKHSVQWRQFFNHIDIDALDKEEQHQLTQTLIDYMNPPRTKV